MVVLPAPFTEAICKELAKLAITIGVSGGNRFFGFLGQNVGEAAKQTYFDATGQYLTNYMKRHGSLQVLRMNRPIPLDSIYTRVKVLDRGAERIFEQPEELEKLYRKQGRLQGFRKHDEDEEGKRAGIELANKEQYLAVLGSPGAGKSTFLRKVGLEALKGKQGQYKHPCIPVFLELKRFDSEEVDILGVITNEFKICGFPNPKRFMEQALEKGKLLLLFDGLDEVKTDLRGKVMQEIKDIIDSHRKNHCIVSCRTAAYRECGIQNLRAVTVADFDEEQIQQLIEKWFQQSPEGTAKKLLELLKRPENASALELARTPLLLTFLCLTYQRKFRLPPNRGRLYRTALDILLDDWSAEKQLNRDPIYEDFHPELETVMLSKIAAEYFQQDRLFFPEDPLLEKIRGFLTKSLKASKALDAKAVLKAIEKQQGIFVERAEDIYSFSHLTIQEYLTARNIAKDPEQVESLVRDRLFEDRWREIFRLVAGEADSADQLLDLMWKRLQQEQLTDEPLLQNLLRQTKSIIVKAEEEDINLELEATVIWIASDLARARPLASARANDLARTNARASAHALARVSTRASARTRALANDLTLASDLARTLALASASARTRASALALASTRASARNHNRALALARALARDLASARNALHKGKLIQEDDK